MPEDSQPQPPQPTRSLQQFAVLLGEWTMVGTHPQLPAAVQGQSSFHWLRDGALLAWQFAWEPGHGIPSAFSIIGHDDEVEPCSQLYTDERGVARIYQMSLADGVWTSWRDSPGFSQRMTGTISADGTSITCHGELSQDGAHWEPDLDVQFTKQPYPG